MASISLRNARNFVVAITLSDSHMNVERTLFLSRVGPNMPCKHIYTFRCLLFTLVTAGFAFSGCDVHRRNVLVHVVHIRNRRLWLQIATLFVACVKDRRNIVGIWRHRDVEGQLNVLPPSHWLANNRVSLGKWGRLEICRNVPVVYVSKIWTFWLRF